MILPPQAKDRGSYSVYQIQNLVENFFGSSIIIVYTDGGTEYHGLHNTAINSGIQHLLSPPYTSKIVDSA